MKKEDFINEFTALIQGKSFSWEEIVRRYPRFNKSELIRAILSESRRHGIIPLLNHRLSQRRRISDWPKAIGESWAAEAKEEAASELARHEELRRIFEALGSKRITPLIMKGTALAYDVYELAYLRQRCDTDILIPGSQLERSQRILRQLGYTTVVGPGGELLFSQTTLRRKDRLGVTHYLDLHWRISCRKLFANLFSFDELWERRFPIHALGANAWGLGPGDALILACIHPVMHHGNSQLLIWSYDIHLLLKRLKPTALFDLFSLTTEKEIGAICAHSIEVSLRRFPVPLSLAVRNRLLWLQKQAKREKSSRYLLPNRSWGEEVLSDLREMKGISKKFRLLIEMGLPNIAYMHESYGKRLGNFFPVLLPLLYLHRSVSGLGKLFRTKEA